MPNNPSSRSVALYASVGRVLTHYEVDVAACTLDRKASLSAPDNIQYAWPDAAGAHLYTASSNGSKLAAGSSHHLCAFSIDRNLGALAPHGPPIPLGSRPVHMSLDIPGKHALVAYHFPARATVHRISADGTTGEEVRQPGGIDFGIYPHQIRVAPSNSSVVIAARGNDPAPGKPEDPGALKIFDYRDGVLRNRATIAPGGGYGFGPRNVDFHPSQRWMYAGLERQNKLHVYALRDDAYPLESSFVLETMIDPAKAAKRQMVGAVHVHPGGKFLYVANRADRTIDFEGRPVFAGGENNIAVFSLNQDNGEPTLIQNMDTHGIHARNVAIDPSGRMLVAANVASLSVREGAGTRIVRACLSTFRIAGDGRLEFVATYEVETGREKLWWMGMVGIA